MPGIIRLGDMTVGHGFPPKPTTSGSSDVFINGIPACTVGDSTAVHCLGPVCHVGVIASGSPTVFVNGKPVARQGDSDACGDILGAGSPNVVAG